jgi:phosphoribosylformylglycinamidine cyclo-ligase
MRDGAYAKAGVDLSKVRTLQRDLGSAFGETFRNRRGRPGAPLIPIGHYGGLIDIGGGSALALHTDGVGTKVLVAQDMGRFDTVGVDCIAMTVNDLICLGAEPVAILDYIALQREDDGLVREIAKGLAKGAKEAGVAVVGGETAIMKDVVKGKKGKGFDLVSMGVGLVKKSEVLDGSGVRAGDSILAVTSSGLHSNGYTLARKALRRLPLEKEMPSLGRTLGEALLVPTRIYVAPTLEAIRSSDVHGVAHITGGSFAKLTRLVKGRALGFNIQLREAPPIFGLIQHEGGVSEPEMYSTFNMGVGLCLILPSKEVERARRGYEKRGFETYVAGRVTRGGGVEVNGTKVA